jgi:hypothetical protein
MALLNRVVLLVGLVLTCTSAAVAQQGSSTYSETRKWLLEAETTTGSSSLRKLFEHGDERIDDLIAALNDKESKVSINAYRVIQYLALPKGVEVLSTKNWCKATCSIPIMNILERPLALGSTGKDPLKIAIANRKVFKAANFNSGDVTFSLIGYNKRANVALLEIVEGNIFTSGWHSVIQLKEGKWWLISDSNLWVH